MVLFCLKIWFGLGFTFSVCPLARPPYSYRRRSPLRTIRLFAVPHSNASATTVTSSRCAIVIPVARTGDDTTCLTYRSTGTTHNAVPVGARIGASRSAGGADDSAVLRFGF